MRKFYFFLLLVAIVSCGNPKDPKRKIISLNGDWQITETDSVNTIPPEFTSSIPVPGLLDLATPKLPEVSLGKDSARYFWYKTTFVADASSFDLAFLHIRKAKFGKRIYVNNQLVKEHFPSFTSLKVDIKKYLKQGEENELLVRVGTFDNFPDTLVNGHDFEKSKFFPGIYDDVELILTNAPYIKNIQTVPNITNEEVRVVALLESYGKKETSSFSYTVNMQGSGTPVTEGKLEYVSSGGVDTLDFVVKIPNCEQWTPENPFLYNLISKSEGDIEKTTFGMREFAFDTTSGFALLNKETYFMRGTNIPLYRFFEDSVRGSLPWNREWVKKLLIKFKSMHWNTVRFHVGPAPAFWYDLTDSLGMLVQDEYAVWYSKGIKGKRPHLKADQVAREYYDWMHERWNHPSIVIWDAQNETVSDVFGEAINKSRHWDLSNRPWDNGWSRPQSLTDAIEAHPYLLYNYREEGTKIPEGGILKKLLAKGGLPFNGPNMHDGDGLERPYKNAVINNEYGWLWVNRDGSPTTLSEHVYVNLYGRKLSNAEHLVEYARLMSYLTEYWRVHRKCAAVMHFSALTYSRATAPRGETSDSFQDVENLVMEPNFEKSMRSAFSPVGLMVDVWDLAFKPKAQIDIPVYVINDLAENWQGQVKLELVGRAGVVFETAQIVQLSKHVVNKELFSLTMPEEEGQYQLRVSLTHKDEIVSSTREFRISGEALRNNYLEVKSY